MNLVRKAYLATVEALKPPDSDLDDETREALDEEMSRYNEPSPTKSQEFGQSPASRKDDETIQNSDSTQVLQRARPKKKRRRS